MSKTETPKHIAPGDRVIPWDSEIKHIWKRKPIKYCCQINSLVLTDTTPADYELKYVDIGSVSSDGNVTDIADYKFEDAPSRARRIVRSGDTIISTVRTYLKAIAYFQTPDSNTICSTGFAVISPTPKIHPKFLYYWSKNSLLIDEIVARSTGVSYPAINASEIGNLPIPVIDLENQKAIAAFLDTRLGDINALISKKQRLIDLLQEKRQAVIRHAVTKGLNPDVKTKDSGIEWLGMIPEHWQMRKLGYITEMQGGCTPSKLNEEYWTGTIPWVSPKDMKRRLIADSEDHISESAVKDTSLRLIQPPVVLIVVRGMILAHSFPVAITTAPVTINQDMKALTPCKGYAHEYLAYFLEGIKTVILSHVEESAHGTRCLRTDNWNHICVFMPKEDEQVAISKHVKYETEKLDQFITKIDLSISKLQEYRQALISAAVTGKIDVREEMPHAS